MAVSTPAGLHVRSRQKQLLSAALLDLFLLEAWLGKAQFGPYRVPLSLHLGSTAVLIGLLAAAAFFSRQRWARSAGLTRSPAILACLAALTGWALLSSAVQQEWLPNLAYALVWCANLWVIWLTVPVLLAGLGLRDRLLVILVPLLICVVVSVAAYPVNPFQVGRLVGMFANPIHASRAYSLLVLFALSMVLLVPSKARYWLPVMVVAVVLLALTRTRTASAACAIGLLFCLASAIGSPELKARRIAFRVAAATAVVLAAGAAVVYAQRIPVERLMEFARVPKGVESLVEARGRYYGYGYSRFWSYGLTGYGFLSKWGDLEGTSTLAEAAELRYGFDTDPHNTFMTVAQQIGIPGAALFAFFVLLIWAAARRQLSPARGFLTAILAYCTVLFINNTWVSFGNPADRTSLVAIVALLSWRPVGWQCCASTVRGTPAASASRR